LLLASRHVFQAKFFLPLDPCFRYIAFFIVGFFAISRFSNSSPQNRKAVPVLTPPSIIGSSLGQALSLRPIVAFRSLISSPLLFLGGCCCAGPQAGSQKLFFFLSTSVSRFSQSDCDQDRVLLVSPLSLGFYSALGRQEMVVFLLQLTRKVLYPQIQLNFPVLAPLLPGT